MTNNDQPINAPFPFEVVDQINSAIFSANWKLRTFTNSQWQVETWESGLFQTPASFERIEKLCRKWQDDFIIITDVETIPRHQCTKIIKPDYESFLGISSSELAHFECHAFGASKKWGLICDPVNDVCYLGSASN